jgi:hypothetical protein
MDADCSILLLLTISARRKRTPCSLRDYPEMQVYWVGHRNTLSSCLLDLLLGDSCDTFVTMESEERTLLFLFTIMVSGKLIQPTSEGLDCLLGSALMVTPVLVLPVNDCGNIEAPYMSHF